LESALSSIVNASKDVGSHGRDRTYIDDFSLGADYERGEFPDDLDYREDVGLKGGLNVLV
jgi:hypothetical protein